MAVNKVVMNTTNGEQTLIDLTSDTVTSEALAEGTTAHDASGNVITGLAKQISVVQEIGDSETSVMSQKAVTDALNKIQTQLEDNVIINSWEAVQQIVRSGKAAEKFNAGDQLVCNYTNPDGTTTLLVWDIIGIDQDIPVDPTYEHSLAVQLHDCLPLELLAFNNTYHGSGIYYNNWTYSDICKWLNSTFKNRLDQDFLKVIGKVWKKTIDFSKSTTSAFENEEMFFLPSWPEVYGGYLEGYNRPNGSNKGIDEGTPYAYYDSPYSNLGAPSYYYDTNRIKYKNGVAQDWALRTPVYNDSYKVGVVYRQGNLTGANVDQKLGIAPIVCIV